MFLSDKTDSNTQHLLGICGAAELYYGEGQYSMKRAKSICRLVGCGALIPSPGYCTEHADIELNRFKELHKAPGSRAFYGSRKWTRTALSFRKANPLCADHKRRDMVVKGDLVDHTIEVPALIARGLNPFDWEYLQTLCHSCHNKKLRARRRIQGSICRGPGVGGFKSLGREG